MASKATKMTGSSRSSDVATESIPEKKSPEDVIKGVYGKDVNYDLGENYIFIQDVYKEKEKWEKLNVDVIEWADGVKKHFRK